MDVADWGRREHDLHARVAPIRAAEYGIPIVRVASSGISQWTERSGRVMATAPFPGQQRSLSGHVALARRGSLPLDRWLGPFCTALTGVVLVWFLFRYRFGGSAEMGPVKE